MMLEEAGGSGGFPEGTVRGVPGHVNQEKSKWRGREDYVLAYKLQEEEFSTHYDHNKTERKQIGTDVRKTKEEQELEDKYAEEYWEQVRIDREREDERMALEIQRQLEEEERNNLELVQQKDKEVAKRVQKEEARRVKYDEARMEEMAGEDERVARQLEEYLRVSGGGGGGRGKAPRPPGISSEEWRRMRRERREGRGVELPPGMSPEQEAGIRNALRENGHIELSPGMTPEQSEALERALDEEDARLAQEAQDFELARFLQKKEEKRLKKLASEEQIDNEVNQSVAMMQPSRQLSNHSTTRSKTTRGDQEEVDLMTFDEAAAPTLTAPVSTNPFLQDLTPNHFPPPRPPPPKLNRPPAGNQGSYANQSDEAARNIVAMGGVRVLPPVVPK